MLAGGGFFEEGFYLFEGFSFRLREEEGGGEEVDDGETGE